MKSLKIDELNKLYTDAKSVDKDATAEMRSNILLVAGIHYQNRTNEWWNRSRTSSSSTDQYKLRITKNWTHKIHRLYMSSILSQAPGTHCVPRNETELQDQKDAELNQSVWEYIKSKYKLKAYYRDMVSDFCGIGECCTVIKFDPNRGKLKGYEGAVDEAGNPLMDEMGQPVPDENKPVMTGEFIFERAYGQNIFRDPSCRQMRDAQWIGIEKIDSASRLEKVYKNDPDKKKYITESAEDYVVFDSADKGYSKEKDQCVILEVYFKPCMDYPDGYFYIYTKSGILEEGALPQGIFPVIWQGFDEHATKTRATSIVKVIRPWQAECNRASSQAALAQITIGEDKILYQAGTKVTQGALLPGVRGLTYQGAPPTILPGRNGDQYFDYIQQQEQEMNRAAMVDILSEEKMTNLDPMAMLFRSMSQSQKFGMYSEKFGEFLVELTEKTLELAKLYLDDSEVIAAVGKAEQINLAEFRKTTPLCHQIKVEEYNDTIESQLGKQLIFQNLLQYAGQQLSREDIGKLIVEMPFGNWKDGFKDFTLNERNIKNDFLAMERGEQPAISPNDDSTYCLKQVAARKKERDFHLLPPQVQQLYAMYEQYHIQKKAQEAQALKAAESEFIPTGGAMIAADMYVPNEDPNKAPKRVRLPYQALDWLLKMLQQQGMGMDQMDQMNQTQVAEVTKMLLGGGQQPQPMNAPA